MKQFLIRIKLIILAVFCTLNIVQAQTTEPILTLNPPNHTGAIYRISTDSLNKVILTCSSDKTAKLWDASNGAIIKTFRIPIDKNWEGSLFACALSPNGKLAAVGGWTGYDWKKKCSIYIFDVETGVLKNQINDLPNIISDIKFSYDGEFLGVALLSGSGVYLYETKNWKLINYDSDKKGLRLSIVYESSIAFDRNNNLVFCNSSGFVKLYNTKLKCIVMKEFEGWQLRTIAFSPDGKLLAVTSPAQARIKILDAKTLDMIFEIDGVIPNTSISKFYTACFSADGNSLIAAGVYKKTNENSKPLIRIWSKIKMKAPFKDYGTDESVFQDIKPLSDGSFFYSTSSAELGRMEINGQRVFFNAAEINTYNNADLMQLSVNIDGTKIGIVPINKDSITFDLSTRQIKMEDFSLSASTDRRGDVTVTGWMNSVSVIINSKPIKYIEGYMQRCIDISDDASKIVFGTDQSIYCINPKGKLMWSTSAFNVYGVNIVDNSKTVVAAQLDGVIRWYKMENGELLFSLYLHPDNKRWILWNPQGYFDCAPGSEDLLGWHINQGSGKEALYYPASQFYEKYYSPNLGASILAGKTIADVKNDLKNMKPPPLVKIVTPENNTTSINPEVTISVEVTDQGGGIDEIKLFHNGKLVESTNRGFKPLAENNKNSTKTFTILLANGANQIKATAFNNERTEAIPHTITVNYQGAKATSTLYVLAVGINEYKNSKYNLNYALADAQSFVDKLQGGINDIFIKTEIVFLQNSEATKANIVAKFNDIKAKAQQNDVFIFYYAGHGVMSEEEKPVFYIVPTDVTQLYGDNAGLQTNGISAIELQNYAKEIKAQKQLFILDACQTGGMIEHLAARGAAEEKAIAQLARSTGTVWIAASGSQQFAQEFVDLKHGLFTYCILQAFSGLADGNPKDQRITVGELSSYLNIQVPELSQKLRGAAQYPNVYSFGQDFPIMIVK